MIFHKKNVKKDLDLWIGKHIKAVLTSESSYYIGILVEEMKNGILIESYKKRIYVPYESILSLEELTDGSENV
jgi:RNase P/RNase MRP subunit p29